MTIEAVFKILRGNFSLTVDIAIPSHGITALVGPSGCGKTTLLRAIAGLEYDSTGRLNVQNAVWQQEKFFLPPHRRSVGYVFQEASLFPHLNVRGNIMFGFNRVPVSGRKISLDTVVELLGIGTIIDRRVDGLSGGERQRVAIARALAASPDILLLDEPLAALDQARKLEFFPCLETLHRELEIPVVYVSHSSDEVARVADHLIYMEAGSVRASGPINDMLTRLDLPLSHNDDAEALIEAVVAGHDPDYHLMLLDARAGRFIVASEGLSAGNRVRLRIYARDVGITLERQTGTSVLNIFPAVVDEMVSVNDSQMMVRLLAGGAPVLSRITCKSAAALGLAKGKNVYIQVKSVALLH